ncbi:MAG: rhomboid family intrarane serine protease [Frankiales bacterium]|nr:rhomboid family intrarane serine protease [Frankiales bacterium]
MSECSDKLAGMVIPIHDANPTHRRAAMTLAILAVNVLLFLMEPLRSSAIPEEDARAACTTQAFFARWAAIPVEITTNDAADEVFLGPVDAGCLVGPPNYDKRPFLSVLTSMFLHGGWLHLLGNMLFLWIFGNNVEDRFGRMRYLFFYLFCGFVSAYGYAFTFPLSHTPLVGASGAIAGVLGAYLVLYPRARVTTLVTVVPVRLPAWLVLGFWFVLQWYYSANVVAGDGGVAYVAHVYGFLTGLAIALLVRSSEGPGRRDARMSYGADARSDRLVTKRRGSQSLWRTPMPPHDQQGRWRRLR